MKRKWLAIALGMSMLLTMTACGSNAEQTTAGTETATTEESTEETISIVDLPEYNAADYVKLDSYVGIEVEEQEKEVTDDEFAQALQMLLESYASTEQITDRITEEGDTILYDYSGAIDGVVFDGGTASNQTLTLGQGNSIDGFEEGLIGKPCGEEFVVDAYFPEDYGVEDLNGKTAQFTMYIHYIEGEDIVPELTDDFVKGLEGYSCVNVEEFKAVYLEELRETKAAYMENVEMNALWSALLEKAEFTGYPENYVEAYVQDMVAYYDYIAAMYGMTLEDFAAMYEMELEDLYADLTATAQSQVENEILYNYIAQQEGMEVSEEEYLAVVEAYMESYGYTDMTSFVNDYGVDVVERQCTADALYEKVLNFCLENAVLVAPEAETELETVATE